MAKYAGAGLPQPMVIGAAMDQRVAHAPDHVDVGRRLLIDR